MLDIIFGSAVIGGCIGSFIANSCYRKESLNEADKIIRRSNISNFNFKRLDNFDLFRKYKKNPRSIKNRTRIINK